MPINPQRDQRQRRPWLAAAAFWLGQALALGLLPVASVQASGDLLAFWEQLDLWSEQAAPPPPEHQPFALPRLYSDEQHFNSRTRALYRSPKIDPDSVFKAILGCYPAVTTFNAEIELIAAYRENLSGYDTDLPAVSDHYAGLVGKIPLYSASERSRQREREYQIRTTTARNVAGFIAAIASRNQVQREIGLYRALEARSQARVANGIANAQEQIEMLEKLSQAHSALILHQAKVMEHRLALSGLCENSKRESINDWLLALAAPEPLTLAQTAPALGSEPIFADELSR